MGIKHPRRRQRRQRHDAPRAVALSRPRHSTKRRGKGIGFAGVGIKLGLLRATRSSPRRDARGSTLRHRGGSRTGRANDRPVVGPIRPAERHTLGVRVGRQRKPSAVGYIARHDEALPEHERGVAISTLGKVIRRGWDWLGLTPADADRIEGLIEIPALAEALTLNKGDFLRHGPRGALFRRTARRSSLRWTPCASACTLYI
jgi:hypothetical protein